MLRCCFLKASLGRRLNECSARLPPFMPFIPCQSSAHTCSIYQYIFPIHLGNKPVLESRFLQTFSPTWDSLRTKLQFARLRWRRGGGGVHLHTSLMVRLLQITHDTSSDDIFQPLPCWMASPPPPSSIHPPAPTPCPNTHINSPFYSCHNSTAEIAASCLHLIDPLSRCWIWSNHSQSSLNISFFKQNRGSKFHHSMTRSVADNTIKPIPAYPEGAISGGTAGRWDYRPTERCQSPLIHGSLCERPVLHSIELSEDTVW